MIEYNHGFIFFQDHSTLIGPVATTIAHEMGHNLGMQHDDHTCVCNDIRCIMAASSGYVSVCLSVCLNNCCNSGLKDSRI